MSDSESTSQIESQTGSVSPERSRSRSRSQRPNYKIEDAGLNESEEDDDYKEGDNDDDDGNDYVEDEEDEEAIPRRRSKRSLNEDDDDEEEDDEEEAEDVETPMEPDENAIDQDAAFNIDKKVKLSYPVDANGDPLSVVNDEFTLPDDTSGEEKIDKDGNLQGGRKFKVRTFKLFDNGNRLFMLATEPARAVGLRDSSAFFQYHPNMYKYILSQSEKNKLIGLSILPYSYRNRTISVVTARSVFKEFGHTIIIDGKENDDDYYSDPALRNSNVKEGQMPKEKQARSHKKQKTQSHHHDRSHSNRHNHHHQVRHTEKQEFIENAQLQSSANPAKNTVEFFQSSLIGSTLNTTSHHGTGTTVSNNGAIMGINGSQLNSTNWLYQHAAACSRYNSDMYYDRVRILLIENQGIRDPYTNTLHVPQGTQSTKVIRYQKLVDPERDNKEIEYETIIKDQDVLKPITGLNGISKQTYEDVVDAETLKAIEEQKLFETGS
ncbi:chromatin structure-remodeling complex subunit RSC7 [Monosporozyma unispora]|nr:hypothetical protein C6P44_003206 [Kazachstania unispora]